MIDQIEEIAGDFDISIVGGLRFSDGCLNGWGANLLPGGVQFWRTQDGKREYLRPIGEKQAWRLEILFEEMTNPGVLLRIEQERAQIEHEVRQERRAKVRYVERHEVERHCEDQYDRWHDLTGSRKAAKETLQAAERVDPGARIATRAQEVLEEGLEISWREVFGTWRPCVHRHSALYAIEPSGWRPVVMDGSYGLPRTNEERHEPQPIIEGGLKEFLEVSDPRKRESKKTYVSADGEDQEIKVFGPEGRVLATAFDESYGRGLGNWADMFIERVENWDKEAHAPSW